MATITVVRSAKLEKPLGVGAGREISADVTAASEDKITAADLGLRTIHAIKGFVSQDTDVLQVGSVRSPGSLMNVIDVENVYMATAGANTVIGSPSYPFYIEVMGE